MKTNVDYKKVNRIRRSRGYGFEHTNIIGALQKAGWYAKRLGGSSANLPDIMATKTDDSIMYAMEAKSVMMPKKIYAYIKMDQILRCMDLLDMFKIFKFRFLVFAFKFSTKGKKPIYHFFNFDMDDDFMREQFNWTYSYVRCDQFGSLGLTSIDPAMKAAVAVQHTQKHYELPFPLYMRVRLSL